MSEEPDGKLWIAIKIVQGEIAVLCASYTYMLAYDSAMEYMDGADPLYDGTPRYAPEHRSDSYISWVAADGSDCVILESVSVD